MLHGGGLEAAFASKPHLDAAVSLLVSKHGRRGGTSTRFQAPQRGGGTEEAAHSSDLLLEQFGRLKKPRNKKMAKAAAASTTAQSTVSTSEGARPVTNPSTDASS